MNLKGVLYSKYGQIGTISLPMKNYADENWRQSGAIVL